MKFGYDFQPGYFADNLLHILFHTPEQNFLELKRNNYLRLNAYEYTPTIRSLKSDFVDNYLLAAEADPRDVFFQSPEDSEPAYTKYDKFVVYCLNNLPAHQLAALYKWVAIRYPNTLFDLDATKPGHRLIAVLRGWPRGSIHPVVLENLPAWKRKSSELVASIDRFVGKHNWNPNHVFNSNVWPDLASYSGVSLHWLFHLSQPLYCQTQHGDLLFDRYTLMMDDDQNDFVSVLADLLKANIEDYQRELNKIGGDNGG